VTGRKKLIEVALPLDKINVASAREKSIRHGHPSTLHLWWARRPLAACRAVLFASLVDDPSSDPERFPTVKAQEDERRRLFDIIERLVLWENTTNAAVLEQARAEIRRSTGGNPPPVLDPFCGGGSIPLEAQRLGLEAYASDLNPVAVLITKALTEIPPRFAGRPPVDPEARRGVGATGAWKGAAGLAEDVRRYGAWMRDEAERRIGHLYPKVRLLREQGGGEATVIAWLWARTVRCPNPACDAQMPLIRSFALSTRAGKEAWIDPIVDREARTVRFTVRTGTPSPNERPAITAGTGFTNEKAKKVQATFRCVVCGAGIAKGEYIDSEANAGRMGAQLMAVVAEGQRERVYVAPSSEQLLAPEAAAAMIADPRLAAKLPTEPARGTFASNAQGRTYGFRQFKDYFTSRQLVALTTFSDLVGEARERVKHDAVDAGLPLDGVLLADGGSGAQAYADAVATYLAFAVDKGANLWSSITSWMNDRGAFRETFARQAIPMVWDFAEASPFSDAGGNIAMFVERISDAIATSPRASPATVNQADAAVLPTTLRPLVCTDPPYYDNIGYADLSDFFYVWLRRSLGSVYPDLFGTLLTPKAQELVATPYRFDGSKAKAEEHFERGLAAAFTRIRASAHPDYPVTLYYAFKQAESDDDGDGLQSIASTGWETMLEALLRTGLSVDGTWPMRTEGAGRMVASGTNALASSIVIVCRPRDTSAPVATREEFARALRRELSEAIATLQRENIAPVDLAQASIGPAMAVFSRYAYVLEADGSHMRVRTALQLINAELDRVLREQEGYLDRETRYCVAWFETHGFDEAPYGSAETLATAKDVPVRTLQDGGVLIAQGGKVQLRTAETYPADWDPREDESVTIWRCTHQLVRALEDPRGGSEAAGRLVALMGSGRAEEAKELGYRLHGIADRKRWAVAQRYNQLVTDWTAIVAVAERIAATGSQTELGL
jgi:putative DNA methylase